MLPAVPWPPLGRRQFQFPKSITAQPVICPSNHLSGVSCHLTKPTEDALNWFTQNINHSGRDFTLIAQGTKTNKTVIRPFLPTCSSALIYASVMP